MTMHFKTLITLASAAMLLAACGGGSSNNSSSATTTTPAVVVQTPLILTGAALQAEVDRFRKDSGYPGLSVTIVNQDKIETVVSGVREINTSKTVLATDYFQMGSLTKAATSTMIARLVEQKKIRWDSTVAEIFPEWRTQMRPEFLTVTLEQILHHRSGLPREINDATAAKAIPLLTGNSVADRRALVGLMLQDAPEFTPNSKMQYSNIGYTLAGLMAETVGGDSYESLMQKELFGPLAMKAYLGFPEDKGPNNNVGHTLVSGSWKVTAPVYDPRYAYFINAAGGMTLTLADYGIFLRENLRGLQGQSSYLSKASFIALHTPIDEYGLGWGVVNLPQLGNISTHNGTELTYYSATYLIPSKNVAIAVTCNCYDTSIIPTVDSFIASLMSPLNTK
ncbi:serine hydrolase domain-containing protein [Undibacterium sp. JH2W]|uniref:serine hydrolase domain-containing protein n=1 Tax=Undibacterium sp. JH2W TaxID=3413037 RepID=UPI003BEF8480